MAVSTTILPRQKSINYFQYDTRRSNYEEHNKRVDSTKIDGITVVGDQDGYCYGCGAQIVVSKDARPDAVYDELSPEESTSGLLGTVKRAKGFHALQEESHFKAQLSHWSLCTRCESLRSAVDDNDALSALRPDNVMMTAFRDEVSKIRKHRNAVVVLCVDAVNVNGTLLSSIRNYVGGNPVLLAVTRCDLLPSYIWKSNGPEGVMNVLKQRAEEIMPAAVYLCSESKNVMRELGGLQRLAGDLWKKLGRREPYIVGCANIGKSTLTSILVDGFVKKDGGQLDAYRLAALKNTQITRSALPGTTLSNIRVPCFPPPDQALWDTPGLVTDVTVAIFPFRNLAKRKAQRPQPIEPLFVTEEQHKSFAVELYEANDPVDNIRPLLRFELRLKKSDEGDGPVRLVWNSILSGLKCRVVPDMNDVYADEERRKSELERFTHLLEGENRIEVKRRRYLKRDAIRRLNIQEEMQSHGFPTFDTLEGEFNRDDEDTAEGDEEASKDSSTAATEKPKSNHLEELTYEEIKARKKLKSKFNITIHEEIVRFSKETMGADVYLADVEERNRQHIELVRDRKLVKLEQVHEDIVPGNTGKDVCIAHIGWMGLLTPRMAMVRVFAPKLGVVLGTYDTIGLPASWGAYKTSVEASPPASSNNDDDDSESGTTNSNAVIDDDDEWEGGGEVSVGAVTSTSNNGDSNGDDMVFLEKPDSGLNIDNDVVDEELELLHGDDYKPPGHDKDTFGFESPVQFTAPTQEEDGAYPWYAWDDFAGQRVGWKWNATSKFDGKMEEGWNPISATMLDSVNDRPVGSRGGRTGFLDAAEALRSKTRRRGKFHSGGRGREGHHTSQQRQQQPDNRHGNNHDNARGYDNQNGGQPQQRYTNTSERAKKKKEDDGVFDV